MQTRLIAGVFPDDYFKDFQYLYILLGISYILLLYIVFINIFTGYNWHSNNAPKKAFNFQLDSHDMILTIDKGTYAVRSGDFIVISLDKDGYPSTVTPGIESMRLFNLPDNDKQHLVNEARKHYTGLWQHTYGSASYGAINRTWITLSLALGFYAVGRQVAVQPFAWPGGTLHWNNRRHY